MTEAPVRGGGHNNNQMYIAPYSRNFRGAKLCVHCASMCIIIIIIYLLVKVYKIHKSNQTSKTEHDSKAHWGSNSCP